MITPEEIFNKIRDILNEQLGINKEEITEETDISNDLNADSLDIVDLIQTVEYEFEIKIPDDKIENLHTVNDIVSYILEATNKSSDI